jgi:hypothetical protein
MRQKNDEKGFRKGDKRREIKREEDDKRQRKKGVGGEKERDFQQKSYCCQEF